MSVFLVKWGHFRMKKVKINVRSALLEPIKMKKGRQVVNHVHLEDFKVFLELLVAMTVQ
jgi:hypothetical protein